MDVGTAYLLGVLYGFAAMFLLIVLLNVTRQK